MTRQQGGLKDMAEVLVEVVPDPLSVGDLGGGPVLERLRDRMPEIVETITLLNEHIRERLSAIAKTANDGMPDEVRMKLGLTLQTEAGVIIARGSAGASIELELMWRAP